MKTLLGIACVLLAVLVPGTVLANLLKNSGFEQVKGESIQRWHVPEYWSGAAVSVEEEDSVREGRRALKLHVGQSRGRIWGRVLHVGTVPVKLGARGRFTVWAKGRGEFLLGVIRYTRKVPEEPNYHYLWQEPPVSLTDRWQQISLDFSILEPKFLRLAFCAEVRGKGGSYAVLDQAAFDYENPPGIAARAAPTHPMLPLNGRVSIRFSVNADPPRTFEPAVRVIRVPPDNGDPQSSDATLDANGDLAFTFEPATQQAGLWQLIFMHPASGASRRVHADVVPADEYRRFEAVAKTLPRNGTPPHLLFIGDSLTDMFRGYNYVDKIEFWLQKYLGEKASVRNAGVGGDFITRVWDRLNSKPGSYRLAMYENLFSPKPARSFIFLGHNDSKASSSSDYTKHCVDPDTFRDLYGKTLDRIKNETGAPVTVISSTSSVYDITKRNADARQEQGKRHNLFGKPEHLEAFNAIAKEVAEQHGCDYLDVYAPTKDHPDKPSLFTADGVHVDNDGNRFLALLILQYLAAHP